MGPQQMPTSTGAADNAYGQLSSLMNSFAGNPTATDSRSTGRISGINLATNLSTTAGLIRSPAEAIGAMLSNDVMAGKQMSSEQTLRMIIALLILQVLLNQETGDSGSQSNKLNNLVGGLDVLGRWNQPVQFSSTHIVQMRFQSTLVYTEISSTGSADYTGANTAEYTPRLDVTA